MKRAIVHQATPGLVRQNRAASSSRKGVRESTRNAIWPFPFSRGGATGVGLSIRSRSRCTFSVKVSKYRSWSLAAFWISSPRSHRLMVASPSRVIRANSHMTAIPSSSEPPELRRESLRPDGDKRLRAEVLQQPSRRTQLHIPHIAATVHWRIISRSIASAIRKLCINIRGMHDTMTT